MEFKWRSIERVVYVATILVGVIFYVRDEARERAVSETIVNSLLEEVEEINTKLEKHGDYWLEQKEVNGAVITALSIDVE